VANAVRNAALAALLAATLYALLPGAPALAAGDPPAPGPGEQARLVLRSGETVEGKLVEKSILSVIIETERGRRSFARADVVRIESPVAEEPDASGRPAGGLLPTVSPEPATPTPPVNAARLQDLFNRYEETGVRERKRGIYPEIARAGRRTVGRWLAEHWEDVAPERLTGRDPCLRALAESGAREALAKLRGFLDGGLGYDARAAIAGLYCEAAPYADEVREWRARLEAALEDTSDLPVEERARAIYEEFPQPLRGGTTGAGWSRVRQMLKAVIGRTGERQRRFTSPRYR